MENKINFYHLRGSYECSRRRQHQYGVKPSENIQKSLASIQKELLLETLWGTFEGDIEEEFHKLRISLYLGGALGDYIVYLRFVDEISSICQCSVDLFLDRVNP